MAQSDSVNIADAIVVLLRDAKFSEPYPSPDVERRYLPIFDIKDLDRVKVSVVPRGLAGERANRAQTRMVDHLVEVAIQKRVDPTEIRDVDELIYLTQEISDLVFQTRLEVGAREVNAHTIEHDPLYDSELLDRNNEFLSVITFGYKWSR